MKKYLKFFLVSLFSFLILNENCFSFGIEEKTINQQLIDAAAQAPDDDASEVYRLLDEEGVDVEAVDEHHLFRDRGFRALHWAAWYGNKNVIEALLSRGADINSLDYSGNTALILALLRLEFEAALYLIEQGADVNIASDKVGITALHLAAIEGELSVVKRIVEKVGADINVRNKRSGDIPLCSAISRGHYKTVFFMLRNGADVWTRDNYGENALISAIEDVENKNKIRAILAIYAALQVPKKLISCLFKSKNG